MSERVLITGATGFVGYHLVAEALAAGLEVFAAVREHTDRTHLQQLDIRYVYADYTSAASLQLLLEEHRIDYVVHAAGITKAKTPAEYNLVNADFSRNLGEAALRVNLKKFVFVSSLAALGPLDGLEGELTEVSMAKPVTAYGASKLLAERYLSGIRGLPLVIIRPTAVYGPREKDIFILFKSISRGLEPYIGNFRQQLSFVYVTDLAGAIIRALFKGVPGRAYNISDGKAYDRYALGALARKALKKRTLKFHLPVGLVSMIAGLMDRLYAHRKATPALNREKMAELTAVNWACSIRAAERDLAYHPAFDLEKGIAETIRWYRENEWI